MRSESTDPMLLWGLGWALIFIVAFFLTLCGHEAGAATPGPKKCDRFHGTEAGKPAPCGGVLGPEKLVREGAKCVKANLPACRKRVELEKRARENDSRLADSVLRAERQRGDRCCEIALRPCPEMASVPWYERPWFVATVTSVITAAVLVPLALVLGRAL